MSEKELFDLCVGPAKVKRFNWVTDVYGFGTGLRKFGCYPSSLPLNIYFSHGVTTHEGPSQHELQNNAPYMFYFTPRLVQAFKEISPKPCYCVLSPNVFLRRKLNIQRRPDAKGTLAFLAHTTPLTEDRMDFSVYIKQLKDLPDIFQPVAVCLHYHDVNKNAHKDFFEAGLEVLTIGHPFRKDFIYRFYETIKRFRFTTSNEIGSYTFYAPEMGIPFFLYGNEPVYFNEGDKNIEYGKYDSYKRTKQYEVVRKMFLEPVKEVTLEQKSFVEKELGVFDSISRFRFGMMVYNAYLLHILAKIGRIFSGVRLKGAT